MESLQRGFEHHLEFGKVRINGMMTLCATCTHKGFCGASTYADPDHKCIGICPYYESEE